MKVVIINTFDVKGGAARAAYRLNNGLNRIGINSILLVKDKISQDEKVIQINPALKENELKKLKVYNSIKKNYIINNRSEISNTIFSLNYPGYDLSKLDIVKKADILNFHWVNKFQSTESIHSVAKLKKPIVWTLHDQNPFTGGCHYSAGCTLFKDNCHPCPQLKKDPYCLTYHTLKKKIQLLESKNFTIVSPSKWLANMAKVSKLFRNSTVATIPNSIDIDLYKPMNKEDIKKKLGISGNKVTILTGTSNGHPLRKGFSQFLSTMRWCLKDKKFTDLIYKNKILILCFGSPAKDFKELNIPYKSFGSVDKDSQLCDIYNASDIFLLPSIEDNLPNTILESMSCGTPVIAFNTGGMPDMIRSGVTGELVPPLDVKKFTEAMLSLIFNDRLRKTMGMKSREFIEKEFRLDIQARNYVVLFTNLLATRKLSDQNFSFPKSLDCTLDTSFNPMLKSLYKEYSDIKFN